MMSGPDYPIAHFKLMLRVAEYLKTLPAQIEMHEYRFDAFGSWYCTIKIKGLSHRIVFDGRDKNLSRQTLQPSPREDANTSIVNADDVEEILAAFRSLVEDIQ